MYLVPKTAQEGLSKAIKQISSLAGLTVDAITKMSLPQVVERAGKRMENLLEFAEGTAIASNTRESIAESNPQAIPEAKQELLT